MIAVFPDFSPIDIHQKREFEAITSLFEPYSDFNFTSLLSWGTDKAGVSKLNGNLVIRLPDYITGEIIYSVLGNNQIDETFEVLLSSIDRLHLIGEEVLQYLTRPGRFNIIEDRGNFDYIYEVPELAGLAGGKYKKKRNKLYALNNDIGERLSVRNHRGKITDQQQANILELFDRWREENSHEVEKSAAERNATLQIIDASHDLDIILTEFYLDDRFIGFSMNEIIANGYAICHFEKALPVHPNIYTYISVEIAKNLDLIGVKYLNWEQDLNIEGLRRAKSNYYPCFFLKKYAVSLSN